jgi:hypothetical protein
MNDHNDDELRELIERLYDAAEAGKVAEDIRGGQRFLELYPAPEPDARVVSDIKARITIKLSRRSKGRRRTYESVAAAAAVVIIALIGLLGRGPFGAPTLAQASLIPTAIWESDNLAADDLEIVYFNTEIEQIEARLQTLESGDAEAPGDRLESIEMELIEIEADFWKG